MLRRNPALTVVAVVALSIGIPASLIPIHGIDAMTAPLPFDEGDRIVGIRNRNVVDRRPELRSLHDFFVWRDELTTFEAVGATRGDSYNVISRDGRAAPAQGAEITASGFRILRVPPYMGRVLLESDEVAGAPDVVVLSWELWQSRLGGDPDVLGKTIGIGTKSHEVVGVMPEGFLFPWRDDLWLPLRYRPADFERGTGPDLTVFGRLADGASMDGAQAELETVGARLASEYPDTHGRLRPQVLGYTAMVSGIDDADDRGGFYLTELAALALLMIVCGNVGTLILARTATRSGEIAVRTALGASRSRIVSQLFVESLVLAVGSAGLGLLLGDFIAARFQRDTPMLKDFFWLDLGVKPRTVVIALSVAALCAVISGVVPALRATGRGMRVNLQGATAGSGMRFGRASTLLIVAEVAMAVGFLTLGGTLTYALVTSPPGVDDIDPDEYLMVWLSTPGPDPGPAPTGVGVPEFQNRVAETVTGLQARLSAEPGVLGVAMGSQVPEMDHPIGRVEVEGQGRGEGFEGQRVRFATVDIGFFEGLGHDIQSGRGFTTADVAGKPGEDRTAVIVNTAFVEHVLGGRNPIGRRVRYVVPADREPGPWYEIVGVVGHLGMNAFSPARDEGMYHPAAPGEIRPVWMAIRLGEDPLAFVPRLRRIASEVDPEATIQNPQVLSDAPNLDKTVRLYGYALLVFLCGMAILLSGAGLYALMSFTVSQRTREIGIRTALGAQPEHILVVIARRAFLQLVAGIVGGMAVGFGLLYAFREAQIPGPSPAVTLAVCSGFMLLVGMLACLGPTLRGLRIQPVDALKEG
jgi:predicted permease